MTALMGNGLTILIHVFGKAAMNIGVHVSLSILVSSVCMPSSGIAGSYGSSVSSFLRNLKEEKFELWMPPGNSHLICNVNR